MGNWGLSCQFAALVCVSVVLSILIGSLPIEARERHSKDANCSSYDPNPKCTVRGRDALRNSFGLPSLQRIRQNNTNSEVIVGIEELKRGDSLALVFQRDRDGTPSVEVRRRTWRGKWSGYQPLKAQIPEKSWNAILAKGKALDLVFAREEIYVCGASFTIELVDRKGNVRVPVGDACGREPRSVYFEALAEAAVAQLPQCNALEPSDGENADSDASPTEKLLPCFLLHGDQTVAAEFYRSIAELRHDSGIWNQLRLNDKSEVRPFIANNPELSWPALQKIDNPDAVAEFLAGNWLFPFEFKYQAIIAETRDRVRMKGCVTVKDEEYLPLLDTVGGTFSSIWERGADGIFRLRSFVVPAAKQLRGVRAKPYRQPWSISCPSGRRGL
jgi:hypothetical protein